MSILHSSRTDLLPVHDLFFPKLSPSAMPKPPPLFDSARKPSDTLPNIDIWRKAVPSPQQPSRDALSRIDSNTTRRVISTSIPKPAATPDVFNTDRSSKPKRSLEQASTSTFKRAKVDAKAEEELWKTRWIKQFPSLTFHFEIGTEDKALEQRVKMMGARVDQFFSARVTHLIVKSTTAKPMAPPPRKHAISESPKNPFLDGTGVTDLAQKAKAMNIKVWPLDKLFTILTRLAPATETAKESLHTLLADERIHGTKERDLSAPRPDYYYFKPGSKYFLIEDATGRNRTVMVKEYFFKDTPEWPTLYERFLRPSSSTPQVDITEIRDRAWCLFVDQKPFHGEAPPHGRRQSTSTPRLPEPLPYQNASGNSVVLTSNIASTSTNSPAVGPLAMYKDRALMQMNKRVQVLKGNARLAAKRETETPAEPPARKTFLTRAQLVAMLEQARQPVKEDVSYESRVQNREAVDAGLKGREQETASGYCENCRVRYSDLSVHVGSRKHKKFAMDDANFESLDNLLEMLGRVPHPILSVSQIPPCEHPHTKTDDCASCERSHRFVASIQEEEVEYDE